ncbi:glycosyltransferase [Ancylomarina longa]|uniref:Glycosyltransferase n=1 Tax=Ancylomarina longa TaxID=2487017 RepID=A0A434AZ61_9BACT|nr:glycosyltransferase [Ancylomarina longa]RUT79795.1 glycosyltransferase [Ancylomarina longa]
MRIAYVSTYPPIECGLATYTKYLSDSVRRAGKEVFIFSQLGAQGKDVYEVYSPKANDIAGRLFFYVERLAPDIVHIEHEFGLFGDQRGVQIVEFLIRCNLSETPVVTTMHTVFEDLKFEEKIIVQHLLDLSSSIIVHESFQKDILLKNYKISNPIHVIPHGVREVRRNENAKELLGLQGRDVLLLAGYIRSTKNFERIFNILPELIRKNKNMVLLMAARNRINEHSPYKLELYQKLKDQYYSDHIKVLFGKFPQSSLDNILCAADIMALPYIKGGQSGVLAQASAFHLPVVTSQLKSFKDWVLEVQGGLIAESDEDYIRHITNLFQDDDLRNQLKENIKISNKQRNWTVIGKQHLKLYNKLIKPPISNAEFYYCNPKQINKERIF